MKLPILIAILLTQLVACTRDDDVTRVTNTLTALQQSVEKKQPREFVSYLAKGFEDQKGRDAQALRGFLAGLFLRNANIHVFLNDIDVQLEGVHAQSSCLLIVAGGEGLIPERMRRMVLLLEWKKESGDWKVYRANWYEPEAE